MLFFKKKSTVDFNEVLKKESRAQFVQNKLLLKLRVEEALESGEVLGPVKFCQGPHTNSLWLETKGYYSRFRKGDRTELRCKVGNDTAVVVDDLTVKNVHFPSNGVIRLELTKKRNFTPPPGEFFLYPQLNDYFDRKIQDRLKDAVQTGQRLSAVQLPGLKIDLIRPFEEKLNASQLEALRFLIENGLKGAVQGPPGTGKTQVLQAIVQIALTQKLKIGIAAFTHAAVDNALSRLQRVLSPNDYIRIGDIGKIRADLYSPPLTSQNIVSTFSKMPDGRFSVIAATTHSWALSETAPTVDLMIIDEAAQVPGYMDTLLGLKVKNFILLGDHRQLPPVLVADHGQEALDMFSLHLENGTPMLETQYRMNEEIQEWSSKTLYGGKLKADATNKERDIMKNVASSVPELGISPVQLRIHDGAAQARANTKEASLVSSLVQKAISSNSLSPKEIGIISPHRTHAGAICQALQERLGINAASEIAVDTVERFQGQEKEIVVLAFGATEEGSVRNQEGVFLGEPRRLNVAVTRAKSRFYCFAPDTLIQYAQSRAHRNSALPSFLEWCGRKKAA